MEINKFQGQRITADHAEYDTARAVWNGAIDRYPRLIARCSGTADVVAAVRFAREHDLEIAIRGGGHNVAGTAVCDDGIVIDLSAMRAVRVHPDSGTAQVQGGAYGATSTNRHRPTAWPPPAASSATPALQDSPLAAVSAGSCASTVSRSTTCSPPKS
jgi:FAD/FMN-containing dehydrogenase